MSEDRIGRLENRVQQVEHGFVELRAEGQMLARGLAEVRDLLKDIRDSLVGDAADESRPGIVVRLDRLDQRAKSQNKVIWALGGTILGLFAEAIRGVFG